MAFHFVFNLVRQPRGHRFISFVPARPGRKGVRAQHGLATARYLQSPAFYQHGTNQHFHSHPAEKQPTLKETEAELVRWRYGVCEQGKEREEEEEEEKGERDRNRGRE